MPATFLIFSNIIPFGRSSSYLGMSRSSYMLSRTMKSQISGELTIPQQTRYLVSIDLGRVERLVGGNTYLVINLRTCISCNCRYTINPLRAFSMNSALMLEVLQLPKVGKSMQLYSGRLFVGSVVFVPILRCVSPYIKTFHPLKRILGWTSTWAERSTLQTWCIENHGRCPSKHERPKLAQSSR